VNGVPFGFFHGRTCHEREALVPVVTNHIKSGIQFTAFILLEETNRTKQQMKEWTMEFVAYLWASGGFQAIADARNRETEGMGRTRGAVQPAKRPARNQARPKTPNENELSMTRSHGRPKNFSPKENQNKK
jgi:hypothetical protein